VKSISLVCTEHEQRGLANVSGLCAILDRIRPEVIFLELPPNAFDQFFKTCTKSNLESTAVRLYRERKSAELVLVDLPAPDESFFSEYKYLQEKMNNESLDSRRLLTWHKNYVRDYGFSYLNSEHCSKMYSEIYSDELTTIQKLGDQNLKRISDLWGETNDLREDQMMRNILLSCRTMSFERAAFLIGAAHRQAIIDKSQHYAGDSQHSVHWDFSCGASQIDSVRT
jgi:hypothetical protein